MKLNGLNPKKSRQSRQSQNFGSISNSTFYYCIQPRKALTKAVPFVQLQLLKGLKLIPILFHESIENIAKI